jgi:hypothetical protein
MESKKRQYYFDGRSILLDQYEESSKFDQNFDESDNFQATNSNNFYNSGISNKIETNFKNSQNFQESQMINESAKENEDNNDSNKR